MSDYVPQEFPKWVGDVIVASRAEERALLKSAKAVVAEVEQAIDITDPIPAADTEAAV